jgi:hypothetical protein
MEHLDRPDEVTWDERRLWFEETEGRYAAGGAEAPGEQTVALMLDLQAAYCAGAWAAVVIVAAAIVDSQGRETFLALDKKERDWLRRLRNSLAHLRDTGPGITMQDQWTGRHRWEKKARRAVELAFAALYRAPAEDGETVSGS